ncbi:MAG: hypothetical protein MJE68_30875, partial [Proteobacteria bacterium]|nr:hypothetical protein [Pseudomonadota bacterium]
MSKVMPDGICLLNGFKSCFLHDFGEVLPIKDIKEKVTHFLCENSQKYTGFHKESPDALVDEVQTYFTTHKYVNSEVCDFLIRVLADVYHVDIKLCQKHRQSENIQILDFNSDDTATGREIWMKFYRDPTNETGNHYDSLVLTAHAKLNIILNSGVSKPPTPPLQVCEPSTSAIQDSITEESLNESTQDTETLDSTLEEEILNESMNMKQGTRFPIHLF